MPMYEYACRACEHTFMAQRTTERRDEAPACPSCAGAEVSRQFATFMIRRGATPAMSGAATGANGAPKGHSHGFGCSCCT